MVFAVKLEFKNKVKEGILDRVLKAADILANNHVESGVMSEDEEIQEKALLNEFGGFSKYEDGPFAGETVLAPPRPFIHGGADLGADLAFALASDKLKQGFNVGNAKEALKIIAKQTKMSQEMAIESNGEGMPNWQKHNEARTIATKGFDKPLYTRHGTTFPIESAVVKGGL